MRNNMRRNVQKSILLILTCLTLASAAVIAGSRKKETEKDHRPEEKKVPPKPSETEAEKKLRLSFDKLPAHYRFAIKTLDLPNPKIEDIVRKYLEHREEVKSEYNDYREQKQKINDDLKEAKQQKNRDKVRRLKKEKGRLWDKRRRTKEKLFAKLQKQIMSMLNAGQKLRWPALLLAGLAMEPYEEVLDESQIKTISRYCETRAAKITRFSFREMDETKQKLRTKIENTILSKEQRKKLAELREDKARKKEKREKRRKEKRRKKEEAKKKMSDTPEKEGKSDDGGKDVGGW